MKIIYAYCQAKPNKPLAPTEIIIGDDIVMISRYKNKMACPFKGRPFYIEYLYLEA
jgi:hypothetical protein